MSVKARLANSLDLVKLNAKCHKSCRASFSFGKYANLDGTIGVPIDEEKSNTFDRACLWLKNEVDIQTVSNLSKQMCELSSSNESYTRNYIKSLLKEKYKDYVIIQSSGQGKDDIITFQNTAEFLIKEKFKDKHESDIMKEKERMIDIVANIMKDEIRSIPNSDTYPQPEDINDEAKLGLWIPDSLTRLLEILIPNTTKRVALGHALISATRKNLMSPLLFGLGIQLDHSFGSKWLTNHLSRLGFSVNNDEVKKYKVSVMEAEPDVPCISPESFVQFIADNVDHNT